jgi:hypothetical protein
MTAGPNLVLNDEGLLQLLLQAIPDEPRQDVGWPACLELLMMWTGLLE